MKAGLTDAVQSVDGDCFESTSHHGVLLQHLIEMVDREGEESAVGVCTHACSSSALGEQTNLCMTERKRQTKILTHEVTAPEVSAEDHPSNYTRLP